MMGAQAQVLQAGQLSLWARTKVARVEDMDAALWRHLTLVRAWAMRRTMFLLPSKELALFVRGTGRRAEYVYQKALKRVNSERKLDRVLGLVLEFLSEPRTGGEIVAMLKSKRYSIESKAGGGWGDSRPVPWVKVRDSSMTISFILHSLAFRNAICSGPNLGSEATYVAADRWLRNWKDLPQEEAEDELLRRYLRAFGPATLNDYATWIGLYIRDAKQIWSRLTPELSLIDVEGQKGWLLESDAAELERSSLDASQVRLLPYFDSFILGHRSHRNIVDEANHKKVYRNQGWVSPVILADGQAVGTWSHAPDKRSLRLEISPFSKLSPTVSFAVKAESQRLASFLGLRLTGSTASRI